jgi:acyl-CoA reductase-like NAD-dependent aldehyde dehydrogenase
MPIKLSKGIQAGLPITITGSYLEMLPDYPFTETSGNSEVQYTPVGVVGCITPWNYPLHQVILKVVPALAAGCTVVLKPSEIAPQSAYILAEILDGTDLPAGAFNLVCGLGQEVGDTLIKHPDVKMVSFTGSTRTGHLIAHAAADDFKRYALEMGGKSASVVLPDADLTAAVKGTINNCLLNSGQTCTALTRLLVPADRHDEACELAKAAMEKMTPGHPLEETTRLGPLASAQQRDKVLDYIKLGIEEGATLVAGGPEVPEGLDKGFFVKGTVFGNVKPDSRIAQEEIFGPVLCIIPYQDEADAIRIANGTAYGLSGAVFSADQDRAKQVAGQMRTGQVFVNGGAFNPLAPFGGFGHSGVGREFGKWGLEEFLEVRALQL